MKATPAKPQFKKPVTCTTTPAGLLNDIDRLDQSISLTLRKIDAVLSSSLSLSQQVHQRLQQFEGATKVIHADVQPWLMFFSTLDMSTKSNDLAEREDASHLDNGEESMMATPMMFIKKKCHALDTGTIGARYDSALRKVESMLRTPSFEVPSTCKPYSQRGRRLTLSPASPLSTQAACDKPVDTTLKLSDLFNNEAGRETQEEPDNLQTPCKFVSNTATPSSSEFSQEMSPPVTVPFTVYKKLNREDGYSVRMLHYNDTNVDSEVSTPVPPKLSFDSDIDSSEPTPTMPAMTPLPMTDKLRRSLITSPNFKGAELTKANQLRSFQTSDEFSSSDEELEKELVEIWKNRSAEMGNTES
jgi:hypothetical protein